MHTPSRPPAAGTAAPAHAPGSSHAVIDKAHARSQAYGVPLREPPGYTGHLPAARLAQALEENRFLYQHAVPVMETLHAQIANTHSMVLLTSARGLVLHSMGDHDFLETASRVALVPGSDWSEQTKGTNAIGTALTEGEAITVHGSQHYMQANQALTCSCAPIVDPHGQIIGALDVTGDHRSYHQHTLALVRMSAQMIENQMFAASFPQALRLHFHARAEFVGTLVEGIAVFTPEGRFVAANRSAQFQFGLSLQALQAHTFASLFGLPLSSWWALLERSPHALQQLHLCNGVSVWCRAERRGGPRPWAGALAEPAASAPTPATAPTPARQGTTRALPGAALCPSLQSLDTGDAQLASAIAKLRKVLDRGIGVMILGETGTGKDLLARAFHHDSARAQQPFVAVNCASIPESLIEAELFGYEEGAFTGARKKGAPGKILQAHGGTLFLDEIGDMPRHLQARLLRVLQERKVTPLGASKELEVDVTVVCATHKNLKELMARGEFREDLYYRLNGLVVRLPALRERSDFDAVVHTLLMALREPQGPPLQIAPQALALLRRYRWPGNVRQLHNLLRTAAVMVERDGIIGLAHLPDDFLEELSPVAPAVASAARQATGEGDLHSLTLHALAQMLARHQGNVSATAKALGVSRNTIYRKKRLLAAAGVTP